MSEFRIEVDGPVLKSRGRYGAGEAQCVDTTGGRVRQRMHAFACLGVVVSGRFEFRTPVGAATATEGTIVLGNPQEEFSYRYLEGGARRSVIALREDLVSEVADHCGCDRPTFATAAIPPGRATASLYGLARKIALAEQPLEEAVLQVVAAAFSIGRSVRLRPPTTSERNRVIDVAHHIGRAYASPLRLTDMAAMAQLSKFHFLRTFSAVMGESPGRYLLGARLRAAADRLLETREPITSVALDAGFNDISHFNSTFRATFGAAPRSWRALHTSLIKGAPR
jgi:AraC family transcriptional regulator